MLKQMERPAHITDLHVQRGEQMRMIVQSDIATRGLSFDASVESLANYLGVEKRTITLAIAIANEWGQS